LIPQVLEHGLAAGTAAGKKAKKEAAYRHVGASGRVYTSDHALTAKERKQIDDYDLTVEVPKKAARAATDLIPKQEPKRTPITSEMITSSQADVEEQIRFQQTATVDSKRQAKMQKDAKAAYIKKYGFDPDKDPARAAEIAAMEFTGGVKDFIDPVAKPVVEGMANLQPAYHLGKALGLFKGGAAGELGSGLAAGIISSPMNFGENLKVLIAPNASPIDRLGSVANMAVEVGAINPVDSAKAAFKTAKSFTKAGKVEAAMGRVAGDAAEFADKEVGATFRPKAKPEAPAVEPAKVETPKVEPQVEAAATKAAKKAAKAEAKPKTEPQAEPPKGQGVTHADVDTLREEIGWKPREGAQKSDADLITAARKHSGREEQIAENILKNSKQTLTDDETLALGNRLRQLKEERIAAKAADDGEAFLFADDAAQKIADALDESGSRQGQAFRARQFISQEDDAWSLQRRLDQKVKSGEIKEGSRDAGRIRKLIDDLEASETKVSALEKQIAQMEAKSQGDVVVTQLAQGRAKVGYRSKEVLKAEREEIVKEFAKLGARLSANPIDVVAEATPLLKRLATNIIEDGARTLSEVAEKIRALGIDIQDHEVYRALTHKDPTQARSNEAAKRVAELKKQADLILQINEVIGGGVPKKGARPPAPSETIAGLRKALDDVKKITGTPTEVNQAKRLQQSIQDALDELKTGEKPIPEKSPQVLDAESKALKAKLDKIREQLNEVRSIRNIEDEIAELQRQLDTGDITIPKTKEAKKLSKQISDLQAERDLYRGKVQQAIKQASLSKGAKAAKFVAGNVRGAILGSDIGVLTRQGLFGLSRPLAFARGVGRGFKSAFSEKALAKIEREILDHEVGGQKAGVVYKRAGLSLTDHLTNPEELIIGSLFKKVPGLKVFAGAGERFQSAFINTLRSDMMDRAIRLGFKENELKARANFINSATGRSNVKNVPTALEFVLTSPRYETSRWEMLAQPLRNPAVIIKDLATGKGINRGALQNIQDMAVTAAEIYGLYKLAEASGYEVNFDGTSSDFLKMRKGNEVWDPTAGIAPRLRDAIRIVAYGMEPSSKENFTKAFGDLGIRPISPVVRQSAEAASTAYQRKQGVAEKDIKSFFSGFTLDEEEKGWIAFTPLIFQTAKKYIDKGDYEGAASAALREFIGQSVNQYPKPKEKK
jgi:hypothetical protein